MTDGASASTRPAAAGESAGATAGATRPILVTGSHRSGSTWLGRILAAADELHYVQEPFNIVAHQRWMDPRPPHQFLYITESNEQPWIEPVQRFLNLRYPLRAHLATRPTWRMARRSTRIAFDGVRARRAGATALVKDPIAIFAAPWMARRFGVRPVVLVRDPVAFVGSLVDRDWTFDFRHWHDQSALMDELSEFADEIERQVARPGDIVDQGIVLWNAIYGFVAEHVAEYVVVLRYETLASRPDVEVEGLYRRLGLRFGGPQAAALTELTRARRDEPAPASAVDVRRDTSDVLRRARSRLDDDTARRVTAATESVAARLPV